MDGFIDRIGTHLSPLYNISNIPTMKKIESSRKRKIATAVHSVVKYTASGSVVWRIV